MRKVLIPIQIKLMGFFIVVLAAAISFYVFYAVDLFEKDKTAYVFESVKLQNDSKASIVKKVISHSERNLNLLIDLSHSTNSIKSIFNRNKDLLSFIKIQNGNISQSVMGKVHFDNYKSDWEKISQYLTSLKPSLSNGHQFLKYQKDYFLTFKKTKTAMYVALYNADILKKNIENSILYQYMLIDGATGENLLKTTNAQNPQAFLDHQKKIGASTGTFIQKINENRFITSYASISKSLYLLSLVEEKRAYEASAVLKKKSIYFGAFIIAITILLVMLFSKIFTNPIAKLFKASQLFAKNDFDHKIELNNKDELGVLADSFNEMSSSIVAYMTQMKEKHRLDSEMQTAKLVQDSFFPNELIKKDNFILKAYYNPATECGGDWWGEFEQDNKLVLIMIDATGHGTPAAFVTAMTFNALSSLKLMAKSNPLLLNSPDQMLALINQSLCDIHNDMLATGFISIIDLSTGDINYSNASHNPPLIIRKNGDVITKENLFPLMEANGKRLGEDKNEVYTKASTKLNPQDLFVLYTDGLLEGENPEGKMWGKRNFYKQLVTNANIGVEALVDNTIKEAKTFFDSAPQGDDITIVGVQIL